MKAENSLNWIESTGGSLLLTEKHLLEFWQGINAPPDSQSDYDRACNVDDFIGLISINSEFGIVFGDEPLPTAFLTASDFGEEFFVRWIYAESEISVVAALKSPKNLVWKKTNVKIDFSGDTLVLFDSSCSGDELDESLEIEMPKGFYEIETSEFKPDGRTSLLLHRFLTTSKESIF